jgi:hypothetical protein
LRIPADVDLVFGEAVLGRNSDGLAPATHKDLRFRDPRHLHAPLEYYRRIQGLTLTNLVSCLHRLIRLRLVDFSHAFQSVDLADWLVITNTQNAWEAQGKTAVMPV